MLNADGGAIGGEAGIVRVELEPHDQIDRRWMSNLMGNVGSRLADVAVHLAQDTNVLVAVQQRVLVISLDTHVTRTGVGGLVGLETGMGQDDDQSLGILICRGDGDMLFGDQLGKLRRGERLGSCHCE